MQFLFLLSKHLDFLDDIALVRSYAAAHQKESLLALGGHLNVSFHLARMV